VNEAQDSVRVQTSVAVPPAEAFRVFTEEIDAWWRRGLAYRIGGTSSTLRLEPGLGGKLVETYEIKGRSKSHAFGTVTVWQPPERLVLEWRNVNFAPGEVTEVEVVFAPSARGTQVTLVHRGWSKIRPDHPARHGRAPGPFLADMGQWWGGLVMDLRERVSDRGTGP
jgi:uncharacterized protein YndB with AHSA1/START domain